jgi:hypothetical protein
MEFVLQLQELEVIAGTNEPAAAHGGYNSNASLLICE